MKKRILIVLTIIFGICMTFIFPKPIGAYPEYGVLLISPNGGEMIASGSEFRIRWQFSDSSYSHTALYYSVDGGDVWNLIATVPFVALEQEYKWHVPNDYSQQALIKIESSIGGRGPIASDISDGTFSIYSGFLFGALHPPTNLVAEALGTDKIRLTWNDNAWGEHGFEIHKLRGTEWHLWDVVYTDYQTYIDEGTSSLGSTLTDSLEPGTKYQYKVRAYCVRENPLQNSADWDYVYSYFSMIAEATTYYELRLNIDKMEYYFNNQIQEMDTAPIIKDGRTLLPIRYVAENIGASIAWDAKQQKATVILGETKIELWVGQNQARVNGAYKYIDEANHNVMPIIVAPGRTMLPLRFIAEALGCNVHWDPVSKMVTIEKQMDVLMPPHPLG